MLQIARWQEGVTTRLDYGLWASVRALYEHVQARARTTARGRVPSATVRTSRWKLVEALSPMVGWEPVPYAQLRRRHRGRRARARAIEAARCELVDRHHRSVDRWLRILEHARLLERTVVVDDQGQERGIDLTLLPIPAIPDEDLHDARTWLTQRRRRYRDPAASRAGRIVALVEDARRRRANRASREHLNGFGPLLRTEASVDQRSLCRESVSSDERAREQGYTRPESQQSSSGLAAPKTAPDPFSIEEWEAKAAEIEAKAAAERAALAPVRAALAARIAEADLRTRNHDPGGAAALPALPVVRLAIAGRLIGLERLAAGAPVPGLSPGYRHRLYAAARRWHRHAGPDDPTPAAALLELADRATDIGDLVRRYKRATNTLRHRNRGRGPRLERRTQAEARAAARERDEILATWPRWLARTGDLPRTGGDHGRYLHVHPDLLPGRAELDTPATRTWLRRATALWWGRPAAFVELTSPDGRTYEPLVLDAARQVTNGDPTRVSLRRPRAR